MKAMLPYRYNGSFERGSLGCAVLAPAALGYHRCRSHRRTTLAEAGGTHPDRDQAAPRPRASWRSPSRTARSSSCPASSCACTRPRPRCAGTGRDRRCCRPASARWRSTAIEPVGTYAVKLVFSDGHDTGLYTWELPARAGPQPRQPLAAPTWTASSRPAPAATPPSPLRASGAGTAWKKLVRHEPSPPTSAISKSPRRTRRGAWRACSTRWPAATT